MDDNILSDWPDTYHEIISWSRMGCILHHLIKLERKYRLQAFNDSYGHQVMLEIVRDDGALFVFDVLL